MMIFPFANTSATARAGLLGLTIAAGVGAQQVAPRPLGPVVATATATLTGLLQIVPLADGHLLVHEPAGKLVLLMDQNLANASVVIDSVAGRANSYGAMPGMLTSFIGDSALFYEPNGQGILVLDAQGKIDRIMAPPFTRTNALPPPIRALAFSPALGLVYATALGPPPYCPRTPSRGR